MHTTFACQLYLSIDDRVLEQVTESISRVRNGEEGNV